VAELADPERRKAAAPSAKDAAQPAAPSATPSAPAGARPAEALRSTSLGARAVQAKAQVGAASDPLEHEADRTAQRVMRALDPAVKSAAPPVSPAATPAPTAPAAGQAPAAPVAAQPPAAPAVSPAPTSAPVQRQTAAAHAAPAQPPPAEVPRAAPVAEHHPEPVADRTQSLLDASTGLGMELPAETRVAMETAFGRDFSAVRVHDDEAAHEAAASLGALAFTRGSDIYFAAGQYDPIGEAGRQVLAHELTHVVQQGSAGAQAPIRRAVDTIQRQRGGGSGGSRRARGDRDEPKGPAWTDEHQNKIDTAAKTVELAQVAIPRVKIDTIGAPATVRKRNARQNRPTAASYTTIWSTAAKDAFRDRLHEYLTTGEGRRGRARNGYYYLTYRQNQEDTGASLRPFVGRESDIAEGLWRPIWEKRRGAYARFDIDHKRDWSMSGENKIDNLWLLERDANQGLGRLVWNPVSEAISTFVGAARDHLVRPPTVRTVDNTYTVTIKNWRASGDQVPGYPTWTWSLQDIGGAAIVRYLRPVTPAQRRALAGSADEIAIYSRSFGNTVRHLHLAELGAPNTVSGWGTDGLYRVMSARLDRVGDAVQPGAEVGSLTVAPFHNNRYVRSRPVRLPLTGMAGVDYGGAISSQSARGLIQAEFNGASPIEWDELDFDVVRGFVARGVIHPTIPVLREAELAVIVDNDVVVQLSLSAGDITLPGPLSITSGMVVGRIGLRERPNITGGFALEVKDLAQGSVRVGYDPDHGFSFDGHLGTMPDKPYTAAVDVGYHDGQWSARGNVAIGPGKVTGISSGRAEVQLAGERISAEGQFESSFRGLTGGRLSFTQDPQTGTTIAGSLTLGRLPGIEGGEIAARVQQGAGAAGWSLAGSVTARPAIPGVTGTITGQYADGAFAAEADLGYQRGMLNGRLRLGVTNQAVGADGRPGGPPVPNHMVVFGRGALSLQLTPWLIGTAMVEVRPNGTIAVAGRIALPDNFTLFDRRELNRRIFSIGIDIPIVGIAVAGQRVGIFATVSGGLDLVAGIGPGQLLGTGVTVSYDPDREDATRVEGDTNLVVPADAGLRLYIRGGVGAGIPLVSAEAGVELGAELGLAGRLSAAAHLVWTRAQGLVFDAEAGITV
jgi:hypothetical protein